MRILSWSLEWAGVAAAGVTATMFAEQSMPQTATPASVLVAFISVSVSAIGLLGWVLREQMTAIRAHTEELLRVRTELARMRRKLRLPDDDEDEP